MTSSRPPRLADWLLLRLASGPRRQSLIGDLHEQYGRGRSAAWYWRQTVKTILVGIASDLRRHPAELAHALCTGLGAWSLYGMLIVWPAFSLFQRIALDYQWMRKSMAIPWAFLPLALMGGWVVGRTVLRFHREQRAATLLLLIVAGTAEGLPRVFSLSIDAWGYSNYRTYLWSQITSLVIPLVGILIGGLSAQRPSEQNFLINTTRSASDT
jgi:hypothetical protein